MTRLVLTTSVFALLAGAGVAQAADLIIETPVVEPTVASSGLKGTIELGVLASHVDQTAEPFDGWGNGGYINGALWGTTDSFYWGIDAFFEGTNFDAIDEAPAYVGTIGGHAGFTTGDLMLGGFVSGGVLSGEENDDDESEAYTGWTAGVEALAMFDTVGVFGQLGYGDVASGNDDEADTQFVGAFVRGGALFALSDDFAVMFDAAYGYSSASDNVDDGDSEQAGRFWTVGAKAAYQLPTDFTAFLTAGYEYGRYDLLEAPDADADNGVSHTVKVGLSIPFGDSTAVDALNPLGTASLPYRAAAWANTLE